MTMIFPFPLSDRMRMRLHRVARQQIQASPVTLMEMVLTLRRHQKAHPALWTDRLSQKIVETAERVVMLGDEVEPDRVVNYMQLCGGLMRDLSIDSMEVRQCN